MTAIIHTVLYIIYLAVFLWLISKWKLFRIEGVKHLHLTGFFLLKVLAGVVLTMIYTYYYTDPTKADIYRYFNDSVIVSKILFKDPIAWLKIMSGVGMNEQQTFNHLLNTMYFSHPEHDVATNNTLIIRINAVLNYFSYYNIFINTLFFNFICFAGLTAMFRFFKRYFEGSIQVLYLPIFLLPSVVFWGSGLLKEQLLFAFIGVYLFIADSSFLKSITLTWVLRILLLWAIYVVKPGVAICLLAASVFLPAFRINEIPRMVAVTFVAGLLLIAAVSFDWHYRLCEMLFTKRNEFVVLATGENVGSYFDTRIFEAGCNGVLRYMPVAFVNAVLRPFIWDKGNILQMAFALENLLFLGGITYALVRWFKFPKGEKRLLFLFCLVFAFSNYLLIGLTVPVMGAIVHYRIVAMPFLLLGVLLTLNPDKVRTNPLSANNGA